MGASTIAEQLYQRHLLSLAGRDELLRRIRHGDLRIQEYDELHQTVTEQQSNSPAAILAFCVEAFKAEFNYRTQELDVEVAAATGDSSYVDTQKSSAIFDKYRQALARFKGDTVAFQQWYYRQLPARFKIENAIKAEDSLLQGGWTIYPPIGGLPASHHWINNQRSVFGKTRTRTARDLREIGLIDVAVYQHLQELLRNGQLITEEQVCTKAASEMQYRANYDQNKVKQLQWLDSLRQAGLLSATQHQRLLRDYRPYELKKPFEVLAYCQRGQVLDLRHLSHEPQRLYPHIFAQLPAILPGFRYTDLRVTVTEKDMGSDLRQQNVTLSFQANGRHYENTFWQDFIRKDGTDPAPSLGAQVGENFYRSINRWLADQNSPLRLYRAYKPDAQSVHGDEYLGLIAMTEQQRKLLGNNQDLVSIESHDNRFSSPNIEKLVTWYQHLGLFSHLSPEQITQGRRKALSGAKISFAEVLMSFPHVVHAFDWESADSPHVYVRHTKELAVISRGGFAPEHVQDGFTFDQSLPTTIPFSFDLNNHTYRTQLKADSDWLDPAFVELIQRATQEQHAVGKFYECLGGEGYIFLTSEQHLTLSKAQPELFREAVEASDE
ncbi:hypothetical protein [Hymenobacter crusticola]|uniref:hypothetical protein n=1 Tax=Hymenobacter crusticola TaxID=1770526 RepID=UPI00117AC02B|nr:hypothetical protein [Hymenobacter crusticola]